MDAGNCLLDDQGQYEITPINNIIILYTYIDLKLRNKLHETMQHDSLIHLFHNSPCNEFTSFWTMFINLYLLRYVLVYGY